MKAVSRFCSVPGQVALVAFGYKWLAVLQAAPPDPKAKDTKGKKVAVDPAAEEEAQKTADAAAALIAEQAAQQCAEHLSAGEGASRQAHEHAEAAAAAAQAAADASLQVTSLTTISEQSLFSGPAV